MLAIAYHNKPHAPGNFRKKESPGALFVAGLTACRSWHRGRYALTVPAIRLSSTRASGYRPRLFSFLPLLPTGPAPWSPLSLGPRLNQRLMPTPSSCRARQSERRHYFFVRCYPRGAWAPPALLCRLRPHNPSQPTRKPLAQTAVFRTHPPHEGLCTGLNLQNKNGPMVQ